MMRYQQCLHIKARSTLKSTFSHGLRSVPQCGQESNTFAFFGSLLAKMILRLQDNALVLMSIYLNYDGSLEVKMPRVLLLLQRWLLE